MAISSSTTKLRLTAQASFAKTLGFTEAATLLRETLQEEKEADVKLTQLGEEIMNVQARMTAA